VDPLPRTRCIDITPRGIGAKVCAVGHLKARADRTRRSQKKCRADVPEEVKEVPATRSGVPDRIATTTSD
jgi:hypothetical protein